MRGIFWLCATVTVLGFTDAPSATAATFGAYARVGNCEDNPVSGSTSQTAKCEVTAAGPSISVVGTANAWSGDGGLGAEATAWTFRDVDQVNRGTGSAQGFATYSDVISISGSNARLVAFSLDIDGTMNGFGSSIDTVFRINNTTYFSNNSVGDTGPFSGVYGVSYVISNPNFISISASLDAKAACSAIFTDVQQSCVSSTDYDASLRFLGISVFDDEGRDITAEVMVTSQSGFDYVKGAEPHDRTSVVPAPATLPLLLASLGGLGLMARRHRVRPAGI